MSPETFKYLVIPLKDLLTSHARKFLTEEQEVEDIIQETFLKLWEIRSKLEKHPNIKGLSVEITKNLCRNRLRQKKRQETIDSSSSSFISQDLHVEMEMKDEIREILKIIDSLPSLQKQIFRMKHIEEYEVQEIAEITGSSRESIRMHLSRARRKVNELFKKFNNENGI